jgi:hypothetical protein
MNVARDIMDWNEVTIATMTIITMMTTWCVQVCGLNSSVVYLNVTTHDIWEGFVTIRNDILNQEHPFPRLSGYKRRNDIKGRFTQGPKVLSPKSLELNPCNLNCWEYGSWDLWVHIGFQVPSPKYDMDAYMVTLFEGGAWDLCWGFGRAKS